MDRIRRPRDPDEHAASRGLEPARASRTRWQRLEALEAVFTGNDEGAEARCNGFMTQSDEGQRLTSVSPEKPSVWAGDRGPSEEASCSQLAAPSMLGRQAMDSARCRMELSAATTACVQSSLRVPRSAPGQISA